MKQRNILRWFLWFWLFLTLFKFGAWLHYALESSLWERVLPLWIIGICMSIASVWQMVFDIPAGRLLDKYGYKKLLIVGTIIFLGATGVLIFGLNQYTYLISMFISIFGRLFFGPWMNAYALSHAPRGASGKFMGYRDVAASLGIVLSCLILPFVLKLSPQMMWLIMTVILVAAGISMLCSPWETRAITPDMHVHHKTHHQRRLSIKSFFEGIKKLNPASSLLILHGFSGAVLYGIIWFVVPLIIAHTPEKWTMLWIGLSMFDFSIVVVGSILSVFVDKTNKGRIILLGLILFSLASFLLGLNFWIVFLLLAFLTTTWDELASLPLRSWMHQLDTEHNKDGLISGIINLFEDLWWAIWPLVAGISYELLGATYTLMLGAVPLIILTILYYLVVKRHILHIPFLEGEKRPHRMRHKN